MRAAQLFSSPPPLLHRHPSSSYSAAAGVATTIRASSSSPSPSSSSSGELHHRRRQPPARVMGTTPEPPWLVLPPPAPENPFSDQHLAVKGIGGTGIPFSLKMVQMKKRLSVAPPPDATVAAPDGPVTRAVSALLLMIGEMQKPVLVGDGGGVVDRVSRDRRDSFAWLFRRVFSNSPNLVPLVLLLLSGFLAASAEKATATATASVEEVEVGSPLVEGEAKEAEEQLKGGRELVAGVADGTVGVEAEVADRCGVSPVIGNFRSWYDVGIKEGSLDAGDVAEGASEDRRRRAYERAIAEGEVNSLILSNYAQFLYRVAHDHDRAEQYFQWAAMAEPKDAEAFSRYAFFLWEERGDVSRAEELFLEAIDADPVSFYHSSNYAWFLWKTGAEDTCFPLSPPPPAPSAASS